MKSSTIQAFGFVGLGTLLGFMAATRDFSPSSHANDAAPTTRSATAEPIPACCAEGATRTVLLAQAETTQAKATLPSSGKKPNIVFIMGDDVGWFNIGAYHRGMMAGKTPNLDKLAAQGMLFTDYYAEPSCTAGRANFITGQLPIRTGLTTVGQAGAKLGMPAAAPTIATALKSMGYATGQFGKNHLGDLNEYLPTVHGFDEFFGYLYHLDAMEDPAFHSYQPELKAKVGPRNMIHSWATETDDPTEQPRWGKVGKQKIEDAGTLFPDRMKTVDDEILDLSFKFIDKAKADKKPFFVWLNPTRMHVITHLADKYAKMQTPENGWYTYEAGMAQLDDIVGSVMKKLDGLGIADDTILCLHHRQRCRKLHLARWRPDSVCRRQGNGSRRRYACALHRPLAGQGARGKSREPDHLGSRLVPDVGQRGG
jgi:hypothetical protein